MISFDDLTYAMVLEKHHVNYVWLDNGSRWRFLDSEFMQLREDVGMHTHIIHFHNRFYKRRFGERVLVKEGPIIEFNDNVDLVHFRMKL